MYKALMNKKLNIYILREIIPTFFTSLFVFTFVLLIDKILRMTELVINKGVPFGTVIKIFLYFAPSLLVITIPISLLIAILFAFARLSADSEVVAMKSCGVSLYNMFPPVISFALTMYITTTLLMIFVMPHSIRMLNVKIYDVIKNRVDIGIKERVFNDDFKDIVIYVSEIDKDTGEFNGVLISDSRDSTQPNTIIAKKGVMIANKESREVRVLLRNGTIQKKVGDDEFHVADFDEYTHTLSLGKGNDPAKISKSENEMTLTELQKRIKIIDDAGMSSNNERVEFHRRFALPFACIIFGIIAPPLGISSRRSGKSKGFTIGISVILIYYVLLTFGESLGKRGVMPPALSMWMPNIILGISGAYIFVKSASESPIMLFEVIRWFFESIEEFFKKITKKSY